MTSWSSGTWLNPPVSAEADKNDLLVTAAGGSDFWQETSYGFRRDSGHALLTPFAADTAVEVSFVVDYSGLYDQAGLLVRLDESTWVKAGVEVSDGAPQLAVVVTRGQSDWSMAPVPDWQGREVSIRASWSGGALTLRARPDASTAWRMMRLAPFAESVSVTAGPYCCAPERAGLTVRFTGWRSADADAALHL